MGTGSFPGVKRPGRGVDHPLRITAEVKERVELNIRILLLWAYVACSRVNFALTVPLTYIPLLGWRPVRIVERDKINLKKGNFG